MARFPVNRPTGAFPWCRPGEPAPQLWAVNRTATRVHAPTAPRADRSEECPGPAVMTARRDRRGAVNDLI